MSILGIEEAVFGVTDRQKAVTSLTVIGPTDPIAKQADSRLPKKAITSWMLTGGTIF